MYPAKLIKNGRLVKDELPDWSRYISATRLVDLDRFDPEFGTISDSRENTPDPANAPSPAHRMECNPMQAMVPEMNQVNPTMWPQLNPINTVPGFIHPMLHGPVLMYPNPAFATPTVDSVCSASHSLPNQTCTVNNTQQQLASVHDRTGHMHTTASEASTTTITVSTATDTIVTTAPSESFPAWNQQQETVNQTRSMCDAMAETVPKTVLANTRGRPKTARSTARSEKRSESARPYKRTDSISRRKQLQPSEIKSKHTHSLQLTDKKLGFPGSINRQSTQEHLHAENIQHSEPTPPTEVVCDGPSSQCVGH